MAEATTSLDYNTIRREVGHFLGFSRAQASYTADQNTDITDIVARGLRSFYWPVISEGEPAYEWSFLRKTGTVTLATNTSAYDMADDFVNILDDSISYASASGNRTMARISEHSIRQHQSSDNQTGLPRYYAIRMKAPAPTTGHRWEMLVYPTPTATENNLVVSFRYIHAPDVIDGTNIYALGGARHSETLLAAMLAAAESKNEDDPNGPWNQRFQRLLISSIRDDMTHKELKRGGKA